MPSGVTRWQAPLIGIDVHGRVHRRQPGRVPQVSLDRLVGELGDEVRLPVVLQPRRHQPVEGAVQRRVWHRSDMLGDHRRELPVLRDLRFTLIRIARPAADDEGEHLTVPVLRNERQRRRDLERREPAELLGRVLDQFPEPRQDGGRVGHLEQHRTAVDRRHRRQPELQRGHHAEVATATTERPEQILVVLLAGDQEPPVRGHHIGRDQVVAGQPEAAGQVPDPAAERQPADAGGRDDAAGRGQPEGVRGRVEVAPRRAAAGPRGPADRVRPGRCASRSGR